MARLFTYCFGILSDYLIQLFLRSADYLTCLNFTVSTFALSFLPTSQILRNWLIVNYCKKRWKSVVWSIEFYQDKRLDRYRRGLKTCPQAKTSKSEHAIFFFFSDTSERRVWLSAESKILASTFGRFRLYRLIKVILGQNFRKKIKKTEYWN